MYQYIAIEGVIGAGKTTYAHYIANHLRRRLLLEEFEDNAFLPLFYENSEKYAFPLELSFLASRYHLIQNGFDKQSLFSEKIVSDFVLYKSLVFASINLKGEEYSLYRKLFEIMFQQIPVPDLTLFLYQPIDVLMKNIAHRGRVYEQSIAPSYLEMVNENYLNYFSQLPEHRIIIIDSKNRDVIHNKNSQSEINEIIQTKFPLGITYI